MLVVAINIHPEESKLANLLVARKNGLEPCYQPFIIRFFFFPQVESFRVCLGTQWPHAKGQFFATEGLVDSSVAPP